MKKTVLWTRLPSKIIELPPNLRLKSCFTCHTKGRYEISDLYSAYCLCEACLLRHVAQLRIKEWEYTTFKGKKRALSFDEWLRTLTDEEFERFAQAMIEKRGLAQAAREARNG